MTSITDVVNSTFEALFYGSGSWFGLLLLLSICLGLTLKWKYSGVLCVPATIFIGIDYLSHDLAWHAYIMWSACLFIMLYMAKQLK